MTIQLMPPTTTERSDTERSDTERSDTKPRSMNVRQRNEPTVAQIIAAGRKRPERASALGAWLLSALTAILLWASFTPLDWGPLGWIALMPLVLLIRLPGPTRWMYTAVFVTGVANGLATFQWMRLGDPTMYPAWIGWSIWYAMYFPAFAAVTRGAVHRLGVPLLAAVPVVWVALEYLRAHLATGFAWYFLSHSQYRWIELIQISDVTGAYGVSFLLAMSAACLAGLVPPAVFTRLGLVPPRAEGWRPAGLGRPVLSVAVFLAAFAAVLGYGYVRRSQADFEPGPRVALIQGNFPSGVKDDPNEAQRIFNRHRWLTGLAVPHQPDVIVWPETMYRSPLVVVSPDVSDDELLRLTGQDPVRVRSEAEIVPRELAERSQETGAAMVIGIETLDIDGRGVRRYNSAAFVRPHGGLSGRYDKLHRVPFGEYLPLRDVLPWLVHLTPFSPEFGIDAGESAAVFEHRGRRFSPIICFEDTVPHLVRRIVKSTAEADEEGRPIDCLVNLTNDGWFHGSSELDQHLIIAAFRAVECRTPLVRAVNTGVSAVVDGDGVVVEPEVFIDGDDQGRESMRDPQTGRWHKSLNAALVHTVPLDDRASPYVAWGDWFAGLCGGLACVFAVGGVVVRRKNS